MNFATPAVSSCGVLLLLWLHCCFLESCLAVDYDYRQNGPNGPSHWGDLNYPEWVQCKIGKKQSPIDITSSVVIEQPTKSLGLVYAKTPINATIYNNGHTVVVEMVHPNSGNITISGVTYYLQEFHFHRPSEHKIVNRSYPMEMQLMHKSTSGQVAAIALLYESGPADPFLSQFFGNLPSSKTLNETMPIEITLPVIRQDTYLRYNGSLTTPPCTEIVVWTIIGDRNHTISTPQLAQLRAALPERQNTRPIQPTNKRVVYRISDE